MAKKGILVLMMLALVMLVGCEEGTSSDVDSIIGISDRWGEGTVAKPWIEFVVSVDSLLIDVIFSDSDRYVVAIESYSQNTLIGTYHLDDGTDTNLEDDDSISISLSYNAPILTVSFTGQGVLNGKSYNLEPATD